VVPVQDAAEVKVAAIVATSVRAEETAEVTRWSDAEQESVEVKVAAIVATSVRAEETAEVAGWSDAVQ
jgi:hypothetical protein